MLLILKVVLQFLTVTSAALTSTPDYKWHDKRTTKFKKSRNLLYLVTAALLLLSIGVTIFDEVALPCVDGPLDDSDIAGIPVIKVVRRVVRGGEYIHAEPEGETRHVSYGGCILDSSDYTIRFPLSPTYNLNHSTTRVLFLLIKHDFTL